MNALRIAALPMMGLTLLLMTACGAPSHDAQQVLASDSGKPDFTGTWDRYPEDWYGEDPDHPPPPGGPFDLKEPYASQYAALLKKLKAADDAGTPIASASTKCLPEGMPTIMGAIYPIEIMQNAKQLVVLAEFLAQTRRVHIGSKMPAAEDIEPSYNGYSAAHWEGDTLVVETRGVRPDVQFFNVPHSVNMKITERMRLIAPDMIENKVVLDDPEYLNKPYSFTFQYKRKSDYQIGEYVCENNQTKVDAEGKASLILDKNQK